MTTFAHHGKHGPRHLITIVEHAVGFHGQDGSLPCSAVSRIGKLRTHEFAALLQFGIEHLCHPQIIAS